MERREFLKKAILATAATAVAVAVPSQVQAMIDDNIGTPQKNTQMKKIVILNGSPRRNGYTAALIQSFAEGAQSAGQVSPNLRSRDAIPPRLRWNNVISSFIEVPSLYNFVNRASSALLQGLYAFEYNAFCSCM